MTPCVWELLLGTMFLFPNVHTDRTLLGWKQLHCVQQILGNFQPPSRDQQEQTHCMMQMNKTSADTVTDEQGQKWKQIRLKIVKIWHQIFCLCHIFIYNIMRAKEDKVFKLSCLQQPSCCRLQGNYEQQKRVHFS